MRHLTCIDAPAGYRAQSPKSCRHYYYCERGELMERVCRDGYAFNEDTQSCEAEDEVECTLCPLTGSDHVLHDPKNCNQFYLCEAGTRFKMVCPTGERFDRESRRCKPRAEVLCDIKNICRYRNSTSANFLVGDPNNCREWVWLNYIQINLFEYLTTVFPQISFMQRQLCSGETCMPR